MPPRYPRRRRGIGGGGGGGPSADSLNVLTSATIDLSTTTPVDIAVPSGVFYIAEAMAIGVTDVTMNGSIDLGVIGDTARYFNNMNVFASTFNDTNSAELFANPSESTGATSLRVTPGGGGVGTIKLKIIGILDL